MDMEHWIVNTVRSVTAQALNASRAEINKGLQVCVDALINYNLPFFHLGLKGRTLCVGLK